MDIKASEKKDKYLKFIQFIDEKDTSNDDIQNFLKLFIQQVKLEKEDLKDILHLISNVSNNHLQVPSLYNKIQQILLYLKDSINKYFSNFDVFNLFKNNKTILSFLIENQMLIINKFIAKKFLNDKYLNAKYIQYFYDEIKSFYPKELNEKLMKEFQQSSKEKDDDDHYALKKIIQEDSIDQFISYIKENNLSYLASVRLSISQPSLFLSRQKPTLIEYVAFYGSFQIFNYLVEQKVELTSEIWLYSIHGKNLEIIKFLEKNDISPKNNSYKDCLIESIKCHHNEIASYIQKKYLSEEITHDVDVFSKSLKYRNYLFINNGIDQKTAFYYFCKYDYFDLVKTILNTQHVDINEKMI